MTSNEIFATHRQQAEQTAIHLAVEKLGALGELGMSGRCAALGLPAPAGSNGALHVPLLGATLELFPPDYRAVIVETGRPPKSTDHLLALHYLLCDVPVTPANAWISFRDFPGGAFYWQPFLARTVQPLIQRIGSDLGLLRARLKRLNAEEEPGARAGVSARIRAIGNIALLLVYRPGDDEFPPAADLLYDACARRVYGAEDAVALGSRACLSLVAANTEPIGARADVPAGHAP